MAITGLVQKWRAHWRAFRSARCGNVTITFALALLPVAGAVGAAVDYSRGNSVKAAMQAAADATTLAYARSAVTLTTSDLSSQADKYFRTLMTQPEAQNVVVTTTYDPSQSKLTVAATATVATNFMGLMGISNLPIGVNSTAAWGSTRLRVALVLDNTGSMSDSGKITALKTATKNLLAQLKSTVTNDGDVYVSIIPFSRDVNVGGSSNWSANWIDWTDWKAEPPAIAASKPSGWDQVGPGSSCPFSNSSQGFSCAPNPTSTSTTSTIPSSGTYKGYICPSTDSGRTNSVRNGRIYNGCYTSVSSTQTIASGSSASCGSTSNCTCSGSGTKKVCTQSYYAHTWTTNDQSTWNGCISDRGGSNAPDSNNYDQNVTQPGSSAASKFPADQYANCPLGMMGLSSNWTQMNSLTDQMFPNGSTDQPIGLVWGWQSLVGGGPLTAPAMDPKYQYNQIIILLSDGLNTQDRWYGDGSNVSTQVDARMVASNGSGTCANIKAAGITIYTVQVNTDGDPTSKLLQSCASDSSKFFLLTTSSSIVTTFNTIGTNLTKLRIAN